MCVYVCVFVCVCPYVCVGMYLESLILHPKPYALNPTKPYAQIPEPEMLTPNSTQGVSRFNAAEADEVVRVVNGKISLPRFPPPIPTPQVLCTNKNLRTKPCTLNLTHLKLGVVDNVIPIPKTQT